MDSKYRNLMIEDMKRLNNEIKNKEKAIKRLPDGRLSCYKDCYSYRWVWSKPVSNYMIIDHNSEDQSNHQLPQQIEHLEHRTEHNELVATENSKSEKLLEKDLENPSESNQKKHLTRTYIKKADEKLAMKLAYKTYLEKTVKDDKQELMAISMYLNHCCHTDHASEYMKRNPELTRLLTPYISKWDVNAVEWRNKVSPIKNSYQPKHPLVTKGGEIVSSKGEVLICDRLFDKGIPYKIEYPIDVSEAYTVLDELGLPFPEHRYKYIFPDITILDKKHGTIIWEHMGLAGDPTYMHHNCSKILLYSILGYRPFRNLILSFEDNDEYIDTVLIDKLIDYYLVH